MTLATQTSAEQLVTIVVNGEEVQAKAGESVASALLRRGRRVLRTTTGNGGPRGIFCGIGACYDCLVTVDAAPNQRACTTTVRDGMQIAIEEE